MSICFYILMKALVYQNTIIRCNVSSAFKENQSSRFTELFYISVIFMLVITIIVLGICRACKYYD